MRQVTTNASAVFDEIKAKHNLPRDADLCRKLEVPPSMVSSMRKQTIPFGKAMVRRVLEKKLMSARRMLALLES